MQTAYRARLQAEAAVADIRALLEGRTPQGYVPGPDAIILPLGPEGGMTYAPEIGVVSGAQFKATFFVERYEALLRR